MESQLLQADDESNSSTARNNTWLHRLLSSLYNVLKFVCLIPVYLILFIGVLAYCVLMIATCIGPVYQLISRRRDKSLLDRQRLVSLNKDCMLLTIPGGVHKSSKGLPYQVFVRFTRPQLAAEPNHFPVAIPNGLGADIMTISRVHELLVANGYSCLSFDRLGVGLSDINTSKQSPSAEDVVQEMNYILDHVMPKETKWILLGPSMGSIVSECYLAAYPSKIVGYLNMDGVPYSHIKFKKMFTDAKGVYDVVTALNWTGIFRPAITHFVKQPTSSWLLSKAFDVNTISAAMNAPNFTGNLALEMSTMMDCADFAEKAWGRYSLLHLSPATFKKLCGLKPTEIIEVDEVSDDQSKHLRRVNIPHDSLVTEFYSKEDILNSMEQETASYEINSGYGSINEVDIEVNQKLATTPLRQTFSTLVVRVMNGGCKMNDFMTDDMMLHYCAEGNQMVIFSGDGARYRYPMLNHGKMFAQSLEILKCINEINLACNRSYTC